MTAHAIDPLLKPPDPRALSEAAGGADEKELRSEPGRLTASPVGHPESPSRSDWTDAARRARAAGDDVELDPPFPNDFDDEAWVW